MSAIMSHLTTANRKQEKHETGESDEKPSDKTIKREK